MTDFDSWVARAVLSPASPLFREARYLLAEDPGLRDPTLYHSVLAAVAEGNTTRGGIAGYIGRKATDLQHPLTVLDDAGLLARDADPLRSGRSNYRITEPLVAFYQAIMRPGWTRLERRHSAQVWRSARRRFESAVLGPHFEQLCRIWVAEFAAPETLGGSQPPSVTVPSTTRQAGQVTRSTSWPSAIRTPARARFSPWARPSGVSRWGWPISTGSGTSAVSWTPPGHRCRRRQAAVRKRRGLHAGAAHGSGCRRGDSPGPRAALLRNVRMTRTISRLYYHRSIIRRAKRLEREAQVPGLQPWTSKNGACLRSTS